MPHNHQVEEARAAVLQARAEGRFIDQQDGPLDKYAEAVRREAIRPYEEALEAALTAVGTAHIYSGKCPDPTQPDSYDESCPACIAEGRLRALLEQGGQEETP